MSKLILSCEKPGLLVSVRSVTEALAAFVGGADVVDVKEPKRGPLGAADAETISAIVRAVNGRAPVTAALGELVDFVDLQNGNRHDYLRGGVSLFKIGLAQCAKIAEWRARWREAINTIVSSPENGAAQPVAVVYADWRAAGAPSPRDVLDAAVELRCPAILIDTWDKSGGSLFDHWPRGNLRNFLAEITSRNLVAVLAGSLAGVDIKAAARLAPDLVAVRGAACVGGRAGTVSCHRVRDLKLAIRLAACREFA